MDIIDQIYANEAEANKRAYEIMQEQRKLGFEPDEITKIIGFKFIVYDWLKVKGKKIIDITQEELESYSTQIVNPEKQELFTYAFAMLLSEYYGVPLRIVEEKEQYEGVPQDKFNLIKRYGRTKDAYMNYIKSEVGEFEADGKQKTIYDKVPNKVVRLTINAEKQELEGRKREKDKLLVLYKLAVNDGAKQQSIQEDMEKVDKHIERLTSKIQGNEKV